MGVDIVDLFPHLNPLRGGGSYFFHSIRALERLSAVSGLVFPEAICARTRFNTGLKRPSILGISLDFLVPFIRMA